MRRTRHRAYLVEDRGGDDGRQERTDDEIRLEPLRCRGHCLSVRRNHHGQVLKTEVFEVGNDALGERVDGGHEEQDLPLWQTLCLGRKRRERAERWEGEWVGRGEVRYGVVTGRW